jgi:uncharacterized integral membrane protein
MSGTQDRGTNSQNQQQQRLAGTERPARHSKFGGVWILLVLGAAVLALLLVFILMNTQRVLIHLYGAHFTAPLGVALLLGAVLGVLLVAVPGCGRIIQLRRATKHLHHEREHLAGRLDEVMGATDPAEGSGGAAAAQAPAPQTQEPVEAGRAAGRQPEMREQEAQPKRHWWNSKS